MVVDLGRRMISIAPMMVVAILLARLMRSGLLLGSIR
jgi:hypothetical protein